MRQADGISLVRKNREAGTHNSLATHDAVICPAPRTGEVPVTTEFLDLVVDRLLSRLRSTKR
jgi:hypothetical protein